MPRICVEFSGLDQIGRRCKSVALKVDGIQSDLQCVIRQLDWDVRYVSNINSTANQIARKLKEYTKALEAYQHFIDDACEEYAKLDEYKKISLEDLLNPMLPGQNQFIVSESNEKRDFDWNDILITKPHILPYMLPLISPITSLLYLTSGIHFGNKPSFLDYSRNPSASASADWLGYELSDGHPGITAWLGKTSAKVQNEVGYAGVSASILKTEAEAKSDFAFMKTKKKVEYKNGEWSEKTTTNFLVAEGTAGASVSVLATEADAGIGSDMLGIEGKVSGTVGNATAEAKGGISVGEEKGLNVYAEGEAMVSAVEGKADCAINILGLEIVGKVGGYAGAFGVEGKAGIENNKFVLEGGFSPLIGVFAGIEVGFNDEGWDNFVDYIVFWD